MYIFIYIYINTHLYHVCTSIHPYYVCTYIHFLNATLTCAYIKTVYRGYFTEHTSAKFHKKYTP